MKRITQIAFAITILLTGCERTTNDGGALGVDPHSFANIEEVRITHLNLDVVADFTKKTLKGSAELTLDLQKRTKKLILDTRKLHIEKVELEDGSTTDFVVGDAVEPFGQPLEISIKPSTQKVKIYYETDSTSTALQWLKPQQTAGKQHPFLFSQSQAILARSWIPLQDAPGVKFTYEATVTTDPNLMAIMSAENGTEKSPDGVYHFRMEQPVSSYLMALAIGDLEFSSTGRNSGVYAEPSLIDACVWEFESMQSMIDSAEALYGDYIWGRYDVVVLPPSFPFGGMENPRLTFATPTIIAGDRSLVALIAHELAHSWSGNLVTNETWNDFWLNEGFTVYFEQRIMEKIYGSEYEAMLTKLGMGDLEHTLEELEAEGRKEDTHLYLNLVGRDPDDGLTDVAYEKGRFFLQSVENVVGRERFDVFLKKYFTENAFKPMTTERFIGYLNTHLLREGEYEEIQVEEWIYGPGLPNNAPIPFSTELDRIELAIAKYSNGRMTADQLDTAGYTTHHWLYFLRGLQNMDSAKLGALDSLYHLTATGNSEIACDWFKHCIEQNYTPAFPALENFLIRVGRRKFLTPLYSRLAATEENKQWAKGVYEKARPGYHSVSYNTIDEVLK